MVSDWDDIVQDIATLNAQTVIHYGNGGTTFPAAINGVIPKNGDLYIDRNDWSMYQATGGTWNGIQGRWVRWPAFIGTRTDTGTAARFTQDSWRGTDNNVGFCVYPEGGMDALYRDGQSFAVWANSGVASYAQAAQFQVAQSRVSSWRLGSHPSHGSGGWQGIWLENDGTSGNYAILKQGGSTFVNASSGVEIRIDNTGKLWADSAKIRVTALESDNQVYAAGMARAGYQTRTERGGNDGSWAGAFGLMYGVGASTFTNLSLHSPGYAAQMVETNSVGEMVCFINSNNSAHNWIKCGAVTLASTATIKKRIRTLRPQRERIVVKHDYFVDELPEPDVMALRPVVYRPKVGNLKIVPAPGYDTYDADVPGSWQSVPEDNLPLRVMGERERLGLIAEDVARVMPYAVQYDRDGKPGGINYDQITVAMLDHIQQLTLTVDTLKYRIAELENKASENKVLETTSS